MYGITTNMNPQHHTKAGTSPKTNTPIDHNKLDAMRELLGDDFESLIHAFLNSGTSIIESLPTAITEQDSTEAERLAHSLKSASANVGAVTLSRLANNAEDSIRDSGLNNIESTINCIKLEFEDVQIELKKQI